MSLVFEANWSKNFIICCFFFESTFHRIRCWSRGESYWKITETNVEVHMYAHTLPHICLCTCKRIAFLHTIMHAYLYVMYTVSSVIFYFLWMQIIFLEYFFLQSINLFCNHGFKLILLLSATALHLTRTCLTFWHRTHFLYIFVWWNVLLLKSPFCGM